MAIYVVRANYGEYTDAFVQDGYCAIGWLPEDDLTDIVKEKNVDLLTKKFQKYYSDSSKMSQAQNIGQVTRFLFDTKVGDIVITPGDIVEDLYYGKITSEYYHDEQDDDCPYPHRKEVEWEKNPVLRYNLSIPLQNTLRSSLTVFYVKHKNAFLEAIGIKGEEKRQAFEYKKIVNEILIRILNLSSEEFEILVKDLLAAIGFNATHIGKSGDGGIDAEGELEIYNMASIDLKIQAKRYAINRSVNAKIVRDFRGAVSEKSQGCIITTSTYPKNARNEARKPGFKNIGLIDGPQLVEILIENYQKLSEEMKEKLRLRPILIPE